MRLRRIAILFLLGLVSVLVLWVLSPTVIVPPAAVTDPVTVYVVDVGLHSRLVLPDRNGGLIQYAYGDWNFFALNQQDLSDALVALLIPTQGTLGRRRFSNVAELQQWAGGETILNFAVAGTKAVQLLDSLNARFNRHIDTRVENQVTGLTFVHDDLDYTLLHNSNHEVVVWLEELDCRVKGFVMLPKFQLESPEDEYWISVFYYTLLPEG
jgi:hypothetical protein